MIQINERKHEKYLMFPMLIRTFDLQSRSTLCVASARLRVLKKVLSFGRAKQKTSSFVLLFSHLSVPLHVECQNDGILTRTGITNE